MFAVGVHLRLKLRIQASVHHVVSTEIGAEILHTI